MDISGDNRSTGPHRQESHALFQGLEPSVKTPLSLGEKEDILPGLEPLDQVFYSSRGTPQVLPVRWNGTQRPDRQPKGQETEKFGFRQYLSLLGKKAPTTMGSRLLQWFAAMMTGG